MLNISSSATSIRLYKFVKDQLIGCEKVTFVNGATAIDTTFRRAAISGKVKILADDEELGDFFADLYDDSGTCLQSVGLDKNSYNVLKNRWMRCKLQKETR